MITLLTLSIGVFPRLYRAKSEISEESKVVFDERKESHGIKISEVFDFENEGKKELADVLLEPSISNAVNDPIAIVNRIMGIVNPKQGKITMAKSSFFFGKVVGRNEFGVVQHISNGLIEIVPHGRWIILNPYVRWRGCFDLSKDLVEIDYLTIVIVRFGFYGKAIENNVPFLLSPGRHIRVSGVFKYHGGVRMDRKFISHEVIHILNVPAGKWGKIVRNFKPKLIKEGQHVFVSSSFSFSGFFGGKLIRHQTICRFRVDRGETALCFKDSKPVFFREPNLYTFDCSNFQFVEFVDSQDQYIHLGSKKIVTVNVGQVGISNLNGQLVILEPGLHGIDHPNHHFTNFLSTQQICLDLSKRADEVENDESRDGFFEVETRDLVKVGVRAILIYKIENPKKTVLEISSQQQEIDDFLIDTALSCLNGIIRSTTLTEVSLESHDGPKRNRTSTNRFLKIFNKKEEETEGEEGDVDQDNKFVEENKQQISTPVNHPSISPAINQTFFFQRAHDQFLLQLHDRFLLDYGINIVDLRIESFKIIDIELATQISRQAIQTSTTQTQLANLIGQFQIAKSNYLRKQKVQMIQNEMNSTKLLMETNSESERRLEEAKKDAERERILAQGRADALKIESSAQAEAKRIQTDAEMEYVNLMSKTELGSAIAVLKLKTHMVTDSMENIEKVVYCDSGNPLRIFDKNIGSVDEIGN